MEIYFQEWSSFLIFSAIPELARYTVYTLCDFFFTALVKSEEFWMARFRIIYGFALVWTSYKELKGEMGQLQRRL